MKQRWLAVVTATFVGLFTAGPAHAGPIIIDGTDIEDGGHHTIIPLGGGGIYIRESFNNMGPQVTNGFQTVVVLGTPASKVSAPGALIQAAFDASTLPGSGWSLKFVDGVPDVTSYFASGAAGTGIMYIPGDNGFTSGGISSAEQAILNANAITISNFVAGGGGLIAHGQGNAGGFNWLQTLIPGIIVQNTGGGANLTTTPAGAAAFPALTNSVLDGSIPWHQEFKGNFGGLVPLIRGSRNANGTLNPNGPVVAIGGGAGTTFQEQPIPEPATAVILGLGLAGLAGYRKCRRGRKAA